MNCIINRIKLLRAVAKLVVTGENRNYAVMTVFNVYCYS